VKHPMYPHSTLSAPRYVLGCIIEGRTYIFTGLPEFKSGYAAREYALSTPRSGAYRIFEERDVKRGRLVWGLHREVVGTPIPPSF
jgi:hypothetical protein